MYKKSNKVISHQAWVLCFIIIIILQKEWEEGIYMETKMWFVESFNLFFHP